MRVAGGRQRGSGAGDAGLVMSAQGMRNSRTLRDELQLEPLQAIRGHRRIEPGGRFRPSCAQLERAAL
jgi:hypothetical protein